MHEPSEQRELLELVTVLVRENHAMQQREAAVSAALVELERLTTRKLRILERLATTITGIRADGELAD
jgi:hypothetical protein